MLGLRRRKLTRNTLDGSFRSDKVTRLDLSQRPPTVKILQPSNASVDVPKMTAHLADILARCPQFSADHIRVSDVSGESINIDVWISVFHDQHHAGQLLRIGTSDRDLSSCPICDYCMRTIQRRPMLISIAILRYAI